MGAIVDVLGGTILAVIVGVGVYVLLTRVTIKTKKDNPWSNHTPPTNDQNKDDLL